MKAEGCFPGGEGEEEVSLASQASLLAERQVIVLLEHWSGFRGLGLNLDSVTLSELISWFCSLALALTYEVIVPTFRVIVRVTGGNLYRAFSTKPST